MHKAIKAIRGFSDVPTEDAWKYTYIENCARRHFQLYGYREIRLPVLEYTELFSRGIGEATDIVEKEMYTFPDRKGRSLTLRPEGTASAMRAYLERGWHSNGALSKLFYSGPMFRHERPQKGRYRQFYQLGLEAIGHGGPLVDAEVVDLLYRFFVRMDVQDVRILLNSLGCEDCRPGFRDKLLVFLGSVSDRLCSNCRRRTQTNPLRVLDCKVPTCQEALTGVPVMVDSLCDECRDHFSGVCRTLDGLEVPYTVDPRIVRGLDYYSRTAIEAVCDRLGSQNAVAAGGRYDGLARQIGGDVPGIGFALGVERLKLIMKWDSPAPPVPDYYLAGATPDARIPVMKLADQIRGFGIRAEVDLEERSLKAQMRRANRMSVHKVVIIGDDELSRGTVTLKDFSSNKQEEISRDNFLAGLIRTGENLKGAE